jgi:hypothetical protein
MNGTLEKIKKAQDLGRSTIRIDEWDVEFLLIEPPRKKILELQNEYDAGVVVDEEGKTTITDAEATEKFGMACIVEIVHDTEGNKVFEDIEQATEVLGEKSSKVQTRLIEAVQLLIKGPTIEEAEGNSGGTQSRPSSTD